MAAKVVMAATASMRVSEVAMSLGRFALKHDVRFSLYKVVKPDHAIITFFDQAFDASLNDAVPWHHYWTPLRYVLVFKVAHLFDKQTAKAAWAARVETNPARAARALRGLCSTLQDRIYRLLYARSRELIYGTLTWAAANPLKISYGAGNKDSALQIFPNLAGFQQVMQSAAAQAQKQSRQVRRIVVDRQTQFDRAAGELADMYRRMRGHKQSMGPGTPEMDTTNMPEAPPDFRPGDESVGLKLVDVMLCVAKRLQEGKPLSPELSEMFNAFAKRGGTAEVSLGSLERRWRFLATRPDPDGPLPDGLTKKIAEREEERIRAVERC